MSAATGSVRVVSLFGDLLGTYGDGGNALVLAERARWRSFDAEVLDVRAADEIPEDGDVYVIGGGEDGPQTRAAQLLADSGALGRAIDRGAALLAVCAGFQIVGHGFAGPDGRTTDGLGLLDVTSTRSSGPRIVGEVVVETDPDLGLGPLTGYENHAGVTTVGPGARALGTVTVGTGNGAKPDGTEGAWSQRIIGTYLHGPVLARNHALADLLLAWAMDRSIEELEPLDDTRIEALRTERFANAATERDSGSERGHLARLRHAVKRPNHRR